MTPSADLARRLRSVTAREIVSALERGGFIYRRRKGSSRVYRHEDGRRVVIHFHRSNDTFPLGTLRSVLDGTGWDETDLRHLKLL